MKADIKTELAEFENELRESIVVDGELNVWLAFCKKVFSDFYERLAYYNSQLHVDTAEGIWLDKIGRNLNIRRLSNDDVTYRAFIKLIQRVRIGGVTWSVLVDFGNLLGFEGRNKVMYRSKTIEWHYYDLSESDMERVKQIYKWLHYFPMANRKYRIYGALEKSLLLTDEEGRGFGNLLGELVYKE